MGLTAGDILNAKDVTYEIAADLHHGESDLYLANRSDGEGPFVVKVGPGEETLTLAGLLTGNNDPKLAPYLPTFVTNLITDDGDFGVVFEHLDGFYSLREVKDYYPDGVDPRDMAWMFRRLLVVLGFAHRADYIHGAVLPQHVMIHPEKHGLVLIDWTHSAQMPTEDEDGEELEVIPSFKAWYPPDATDMAGTWTDVYMAANLMSWLMGGDPESATLPTGIEREYRVFLGTCMNIDWRKRPSEGWGVLQHFDSLIERLYGRRRFREFHIPPKEA